MLTEQRKNKLFFYFLISLFLLLFTSSIIISDENNTNIKYDDFSTQYEYLKDKYEEHLNKIDSIKFELSKEL